MTGSQGQWPLPVRTVLCSGFLHQSSPLPSEMLSQVHGQSLPVLGRVSGVLQPQSAKQTTHTHTHIHTHPAQKHTQEHTQAHTQINTETQTKKQTQSANTHKQPHKCTPTHLHKYSRKHKRNSLQKQINGHTEKCVQIYKQKHIHTNAPIHTNTHIHANTHTNTQTQEQNTLTCT